MISGQEKIGLLLTELSAGGVIMYAKSFLESITDDNLNLPEEITNSDVIIDCDPVEINPALKPKARKSLESYLDRKRLRNELTFLQ